MFLRLALIARGFTLLLAAFLVSPVTCSAASSWTGVLRDAAGNPIDKAEIHLKATDGSHEYSATTTATGQFTLIGISEGSYNSPQPFRAKLGMQLRPCRSRMEHPFLPFFNSLFKARNFTSYTWLTVLRRTPRRLRPA